MPKERLICINGQRYRCITDKSIFIIDIDHQLYRVVCNQESVQVIAIHEQAKAVREHYCFRPFQKQ